MPVPHPAQIHPLVPLPAEVLALCDPYGRELHEAPMDGVISAFVQGQRGVVGRRQLLAVGISERAINCRLQRRRLVPRFRGVYAPGHVHLTLHGHRTAVVLAVAGSILTHGSGTRLRGIGPDGGRWHVTVPGDGGRRSMQGIEVHTSTTLAPQDIEVFQGVPTTSVARSIVDAASHLYPRQLANLLARAERASLLDIDAVVETHERLRTRPGPGPARMAAVLDEHTRLGAQLSRSDVEAAFRQIAVRAGLPAPQLNRMVGGDEVDALWPELSLGIEIDSWTHHRDRRSFVADRAKLRRLHLAGLTVLPFTAADVVDRPDVVARELAVLIARAAGRPVS